MKKLFTQKREDLPELDVAGWRVYKVIPGLGILHSVSAADAILSREPPPCKCSCDRKRVQGPPPHAGEHCGYFAFYEKHTAVAQLSPKGAVAKVTAFGETMLCENGFQAERIRLEELWVAAQEGLSGETVAAVSRRYELPVYELEEEDECKSASQSSESARLEARMLYERMPASQPPPLAPPLSFPQTLGFALSSAYACRRCARPVPSGIACPFCGQL